jgi:hypothetical protein
MDVAFIKAMLDTDDESSWSSGAVRNVVIVASGWNNSTDRATGSWLVGVGCEASEVTQGHTSYSSVR